MTGRLESFTRRAWIGALGASLMAAEKEYSIAGIRFREIKNGKSKRRYLHIHGNETTAREVLRDHMTRFKGSAYLVVGEKRNVDVSGGCLIDPNRMFSRVGAEKSLRRVNNGIADDKVGTCSKALDRDRDKFVKRILPPRGGVMIAMHNNSEGYSVNDEVAISDEVSLPEKDNPRDFMLATNAADFARIAKGPFNVVLQKSVRNEDGSFSVLAATRGIRYVNIEAALGKKERQREMIEFLEKVLP